MKQRLAGKIIKHKDRYPYEMINKAYDKSVRGLRRYYKRMYKECEQWHKKWYAHKAAEPSYMLVEDVDDIWNVNDGSL